MTDQRVTENNRYPEFTVGGLCSGIGGLELGLERAGMRTIWQSETDPYASKVLAKHWPGVPNLGDLTAVDWSEVVRPDLVCGGFPCQPFSHAGARKGADDPRRLWPHIAACLRILRPEWALLENVPGLLTLGFGEVAADLAALGYDLEWECIPAAAVGAPHLRYRIFVVAHAQSLSDPHIPGGAETDRTQSLVRPQLGASGRGDGRAVAAGSRILGRLATEVAAADVADTDSVGRVGRPLADADGTTGRPARRPGQTVFRSGALERPGRCSCCDRDHWESEPDVGRVAHGIPRRVDRLRALGNAVVPQVAELVGRRILKAAS